MTEASSTLDSATPKADASTESQMGHPVAAVPAMRRTAKSIFNPRYSPRPPQPPCRPVPENNLLLSLAGRWGAGGQGMVNSGYLVCKQCGRLSFREIHGAHPQTRVPHLMTSQWPGTSAIPANPG